MTNVIIDKEELPEALEYLVQSKKVRVVQEDKNVIKIYPILDANEVRGIAKGSKLTVERFLELSREDKE